ncbi:MAG: permease-like cell division protein FtsX [Candidatus Thiosymbion ectosymbiont of Robbea hypermnestra]|nr:permease-like cell division protein FtsX [Candidatus Thiosymbion ectosymbiont of Robbea hypermnestra]
MRTGRRSAHRRARVSPLRLPVIWLAHHLQVALGSLGHLLRNPLATGMTVAVIAVALALPAGLYALIRNLDLLSESWNQTATISLFLTMDTDLEQARALAAELEAHRQLDQVTLISPDQALSELGSYSGFGEAITQLEENPLPVVLTLQPTPDLWTPAALERLAEEAETRPQVDFARLDTQWVRRFQAILNLAQRGVMLLGGALALAVLLVVGNTIRLEIENRRNEIEIMELVGATPAFIRRPFLYTGGWYGLFGGLGAWVLVALALVLIQGPVSRLAALYHTQFPLTGLGPTASLTILGGSLCLGLLGSWLSVGRHLGAAQPH